MTCAIAFAICRSEELIQNKMICVGPEEVGFKRENYYRGDFFFFIASRFVFRYDAVLGLGLVWNTGRRCMCP